MTLPDHERVWPWSGCGFVRVLLDDPPISSHRLPRDVAAGFNLHLLFEACPEMVGSLLELVVIKDASSVEGLSEYTRGESPGSIALESETALLDLPIQERETSQTLQVVALVTPPAPGQKRVWFADTIEIRH
ncbi:MAG: hypothetical protein EPO16_02485 [Dehalococcoidia bacterium]|nr:MAG: hypothetical protein EPO16_02485 [Dehalococcoidia bacterium]